MTHLKISTLLAAALLGTFILSGAAPSIQEGDELPPGIAVEAGEIRVTEAEFHDYLSDLYRDQESGLALLNQIIHETAIRQEAERRKIHISRQALDARFDELDQAVRAGSGGKKGLLDTIREQNVAESEFFEALRLSIAHETMARSDFGMDRKEPVPVEKLNLWLKELLSKKKIVRKDLEKGVAATIDGSPISTAFFARRLISHLGARKISGLLTEAIGIRLIIARAAELGLSLTENEIDAELERREKLLRKKKGFETISYANFLEASTGRSIEELRSSEKFRAEVLMQKIAHALIDEDGLLDYFKRNRQSYELRFGEAARVATIFMKAAQFPNKQVNRSFEDAIAELKAIRKRIDEGEASFENMARIYSEHESGEKGGGLGFLPPASRGFEEIARDALRAEVGAVLGPYTVPDGCHLIRTTGKRGPVKYKAVRETVRYEARQNMYRKLIEEAGIRKKY